MRVRLVQLDGDLPNMALMKLAYYYRRELGAQVDFTRSVRRDIFTPEYDLVLASQIFSTTWKKAQVLKENYPEAIIGGTGTGDLETTVESFLGIAGDYKNLDYTDYPDFQDSIGMTQLGCTKNCGFCCVRAKEGENRPFSNIGEIYRGEIDGKPAPKNLILLDNDFQNREGWQTICEEIINGDFRVAFIQGINIREITREHGTYFARMKFRDRSFKKRRFYCAWDFERDFKKIEAGLHVLDAAGFRRHEITPYFIANYLKPGLTEDVWTRFLKMAEWGLRPYSMIYKKWELPPNHELKDFQNWVNTHKAYRKPTKEGFEEYRKYYRQRKKDKENEKELMPSETPLFG